jgi:23S rRNA (cytosine1962-C5)-methyltransferase
VPATCGSTATRSTPDATPLTDSRPAHRAAAGADGRFLGYAGVNPHSLIAARILSRDPAQPPGPFPVRAPAQGALALRDRLYPSGCYRALFGEGDGLPGWWWIASASIVVLQAGTAAIEAMKGEVVDAVQKVLAPTGILWRNDAGAREPGGLERYVEVAAGEVPEEVRVFEDGVEFGAPVRQGQKTGWFYDQRDNRARLARYRPPACWTSTPTSAPGACRRGARRARHAGRCLRRGAGRMPRAMPGGWAWRSRRAGPGLRRS